MDSLLQTTPDNPARASIYIPWTEEGSGPREPRSIPHKQCPGKTCRRWRPKPSWPRRRRRTRLSTTRPISSRLLCRMLQPMYGLLWTFMCPLQVFLCQLSLQCTHDRIAFWCQPYLWTCATIWAQGGRPLWHRLCHTSTRALGLPCNGSIGGSCYSPHAWTGLPPEPPEH